MTLIPEEVDTEEVEEKLKELGWEHSGLRENELLENVIHDKIFEEAFLRLNERLLRNLTDKEIAEVIGQVKDRLRSPEEKVLEYLKHGITLTIRGKDVTFILIDFNDISRNVFTYGRDVKFRGRPENVKPDFTLFVNGIPLAIIEVEPTSEQNSEQRGIDQIKSYEQRSFDLFKLVQIGIIYAYRKGYIPTYPNRERKDRTIFLQTWKVERDGKKVEDIFDLLKPSTLLNIVRWYTFFKEEDGELKKIVARYPQYIASEKAIKRIREYLSGKSEKKDHLIWHWQGSGKTYTMFFIANRFYEEFYAKDPVIIFLLDRIELQRQLYEDFIQPLKVSRFSVEIVDSIEKLKEIVATLKRSEYKAIIPRGIYIVLIQKFRREEFIELLKELGKEYLLEKEGKFEEDEEELIRAGAINKREVLILIDEAHRSQYGILASTMKMIFPNAIRIAFTGTPVFSFERNTFEEFGKKPLDIYFIKDSIEDGFTVPIAYQIARGDFNPRIREEDIKGLIREYIEQAKELGVSIADDIDALIEGEEVRITRSELRKHLNDITVRMENEQRIRNLARYIAGRIEEDTEGFRFKAMVVTASRKCCVLLKKFLDEELSKRYGNVEGWVEVVMTYRHDDRDEILNYKEKIIERFGDWRIANKKFQDDFKKKDKPKILIVHEMLITGFDVPTLKVLYLDRPIYEHRLLQTIARVNRPYESGEIKKEFGLVVDTIPLLEYVKESFRKYNVLAEEYAEDVEENMLREIEHLIDEFRYVLSEAKNSLKRYGIDIDELRRLKGKDLKDRLEDVKSRLKLIACEDSTLLVEKIKRAISLYRALGAREEKAIYSKDIAILSCIYSALLKLLGYRDKKYIKLGEDFWRWAIKEIHKKIEFEEYKDLIEVIIDKSVIEEFKGEINEYHVANLYFYALQEIGEETVNPVHRKIRERIEEIRRRWIKKLIGSYEAAKEIKRLLEEKRKYDEKIKSVSKKQFVIETLRNLVGLDIQFKNLEEKLSHLKEDMPERIIRRELRVALTKDVVKYLKREEREKFLEEALDFIIGEIYEKAGS